MEGYRRTPRRVDVRRDVWEVQDGSRRNDRNKGKASAKKQGKILSKLRGIREVSERKGMKSHLRGPMGFAKTLKLRFRVGDLDLPQRRKRGIPGEEVDAQLCACSKAME